MVAGEFLLAFNPDQNIIALVIDCYGLDFAFQTANRLAVPVPDIHAVYDDRDRSTFVYVSDRSNNRVLKYEFTGTSSSGLEFITSAGSQGGGSNSFNGPMGLAVDSCGNVWVADRVNNRIQQLDRDLNFRSRFTSSFDRPTGVAVSPNGKFLYVADSANDQIQKFDLR